MKLNMTINASLTKMYMYNNTHILQENRLNMYKQAFIKRTRRLEYIEE